MFITTYSFGQRTDSQAYNNGCLDGKSTAYSSNFQDTLDSILLNPSISDEYKDSYKEGFYACREEELRGEKLSGPNNKYGIVYISGVWIYY